MIEFGNILRAAGLSVVEEPGWRTRTHPGSFTPVGIVWHHTGGLNALGVVVNGRADLAGPLCNLYLDRQANFHVIASGVAWHAGPGSRRRYEDARAGIAPLPVRLPNGTRSTYAADVGLVDDFADGNHVFVGIEVEALGDHSPYPAAQVQALVRGSAAIARALHFTDASMIHHREWTKRKVDMDLADSLDLRALVRAELAPPAKTGQNGDIVKILVIDAPGRPKALFSPGGSHAFRPLSPGEWQALWRAVAEGTDSTGQPNGKTGWRDDAIQIVIETRPAAEYDAATGYQA